MTVVPFDTLTLADRLQAGGFNPEPSRAAVFAFALGESGIRLASKGDIRAGLNEAGSRLEARIVETKSAFCAGCSAPWRPGPPSMSGWSDLLGH